MLTVHERTCATSHIEQKVVIIIKSPYCAEEMKTCSKTFKAFSLIGSKCIAPTPWHACATFDHDVLPISSGQTLYLHEMNKSI